MGSGDPKPDHNALIPTIEERYLRFRAQCTVRKLKVWKEFDRFMKQELGELD